MSVERLLNESEYEQFVWAHPDSWWELLHGRLREKPGSTWEKGCLAAWLAYLLHDRLDHRQFRVSINLWRVSLPNPTIFIPDLVVVPTAYGRDFAGRPDKLAIFSDPVPLVVEFWSIVSPDYDTATKLPVYQQRGDLEIWFIHPYEQTVTAQVRQPDGRYLEAVYHDGIVKPSAYQTS